MATKKYNIDLKKSYFIGNSKFDFFCSRKANIKYLHIGTKDLALLNRDVKKFKNIYNAVKYTITKICS